MKTIRHTRTLFYYDGSQVFEARDAIGGHYVAVMVEPESGRDRYLVVAVASERLRQFLSGTLDLRSLLAEGGEKECYFATPEAGLDKPLALVAQSTPLVSSGLLPEAGFMMPDVSNEAEGRREVRVKSETGIGLSGGNCGKT